MKKLWCYFFHGRFHEAEYSGTVGGYKIKLGKRWCLKCKRWTD